MLFCIGRHVEKISRFIVFYRYFVATDTPSTSLCANAISDLGDLNLLAPSRLNLNSSPKGKNNVWFHPG